MEIKGILKGKVGEKTGVSQSTGNAWRTAEWLLVVPGEREKCIKFDVRGEQCEMWDKFFEGMPDKNQPVKVYFNIDAHEYNGRWFNEVRATNISVSEW